MSHLSINNPIETLNVYHLFEPFDYTFLRQLMDKEKRLKDEKLERAYPEVRSDLSLDLFDKTLVNMFEDL